MKPEKELGKDQDDLTDEQNDILDNDPNEQFDDNEDFLNDNDNFGYDDFGLGGDMQTPLERHSDLLKELTNFDPYLKEIVNGWLGRVWNEEEQKYITDSKLKPIMNERCAAWCVSYLKTYTRNNNIMTNIAEIQYIHLIEDVITTVWLNIGTKCVEFGIVKEGNEPDNGNIRRICVEMQAATELVLMGAGDGKYNQFMSTVTQRNENISPQQPLNQNMNRMPIGYNPMMMNPEMIMQQKVPGMIKRIKNFALGK